MKRFFPTSLALLLVVGSLGHMFAATFCPRVPGHDCCLKGASSHQQSSQTHQHMHGMDSVAKETMPTNCSDMQGMTMAVAEAAVPASSLGINEIALVSTAEEVLPANQLDLPVEACTHCMSHSGVPNAPISSVGVADQSNKDLGSVSLAASRFLVRPAMALAQFGLPREHAPPGRTAPRHILINVFLI